ncbi:ABC transporter-like [Syntrophomonas zehnderi OL-4]|uniref:ABC transporter-like n=1 Tax=Syntrophomonas zehnderi OL-4 TaxID=690567 RepID=A0A0E4C8J7_9FIRM|nr:ABC transporter ATP-binding protein [Syntrophomonas zehnderi]CFX53139.1 ABC transporter-like [Syntrophomonas zehnderi OL-4]
MSFTIDHVNKSFAGLEVIKDLFMQVEENQIICILGPSGAGKTTLLNIISGVIPADRGKISGFADKNISYLFQEHRLLPWKTVEDNIDFVLKDKISLKERKRIIAHYLDMVDLTAFSAYYPSQLSGGMKQRVALARAFAYPSEILLMDEPFKGLDYHLKRTLREAFIKLWQADKRSVFFVTHDIEEALLMGQEIYVLTDRPATVKGKVPNPIPYYERTRNNSALQRIENEIHQLLSSRV